MIFRKSGPRQPGAYWAILYIPFECAVSSADVDRERPSELAASAAFISAFARSPGCVSACRLERGLLPSATAKASAAHRQRPDVESCEASVFLLPTSDTNTFLFGSNTCIQPTGWPKKWATTKLSKICIKSYYCLPVRLDLFTKLKYQSSNNITRL